MKRIVVFMLGAIAVNAMGQSVIDVTPGVKNITVYQSGAMMTNEVKVKVPAGRSTVVFHGLPSRIDEQSIELASTGNLTILSVSTHTDYLTARAKSGKMRIWQDSLDMLNDKLERTNNGIDILNDSKKMLDANRTVGGANTGTTVSNLKAMYDYYVHQVNEIDDSLIGMRKRQQYYNAKIRKVQGEVDEWRRNTDTITSQVEAVISSDQSQSVSFRISYVTNDAGWYPSYDLRVSDDGKTTNLTYKANVYQHTGEDWKDADITLSTANPQVSQTAPVLNPWFLQLYTPVTYNYKYAPAPAAGVVEDREEAAKNETYQQNVPVATSTSENQIAIVEFHIDVPYPLPSDNKPHIFVIKDYQLTPTYRYQAIPKLDLAAFLMADVTDWDKLDLQPGEVNIYYSGAYVGKTTINTQNPGDTLSFSLGRDKKIVVNRERIKKFSATHWIGSSKVQTFGYTITVHNGHSDTLSVEVFDQVPLSTDKDIQIEVLDKGSAALDPATGRLTWKIFLKAGETKKLTFSYSVKYPKDKVIQNLW